MLEVIFFGKKKTLGGYTINKERERTVTSVSKSKKDLFLIRERERSNQ